MKSESQQHVGSAAAFIARNIYIRLRRKQRDRDLNFLRTLWPSSFGLPVIVARAELLVAVRAGRHAEACLAALLAEEHAGLLVRRRGASARAAVGALCEPIEIEEM